MRLSRLRPGPDSVLVALGELLQELSHYSHSLCLGSLLWGFSAKWAVFFVPGECFLQVCSLQELNIILKYVIPLHCSFKEKDKSLNAFLLDLHTAVFFQLDTRQQGAAA